MRHTIHPARKFEDDPRLEGYVSFHGEDPFEVQNGPFCWKDHEDGTSTCAFIAKHQHLNDDGFIHGGCLMAFADFGLFRISHEARKGAPTVTVSFTSEFTAAGKEGDFVQCEGVVVRDTRSMTFVRGEVFVDREDEGRVVLLNFSGILKKLRT